MSSFPDSVPNDLRFAISAACDGQIFRTNVGPQTALQLAVRIGDFDLVKGCLARGGDPNTSTGGHRALSIIPYAFASSDHQRKRIRNVVRSSGGRHSCLSALHQRYFDWCSELLAVELALQDPYRVLRHEHAIHPVPKSILPGPFAPGEYLHGVAPCHGSSMCMCKKVYKSIEDRRDSAAPVEILPGLYLGSIHHIKRSPEAIRALGITVLVSVCDKPNDEKAVRGIVSDNTRPCPIHGAASEAPSPTMSTRPRHQRSRDARGRELDSFPPAGRHAQSDTDGSDMDDCVFTSRDGRPHSAARRRPRPGTTGAMRLDPLGHAAAVRVLSPPSAAAAAAPGYTGGIISLGAPRDGYTHGALFESPTAPHPGGTLRYQLGALPSNPVGSVGSLGTASTGFGAFRGAGSAFAVADGSTHPNPGCRAAPPTLSATYSALPSPLTSTVRPMGAVASATFHALGSASPTATGSLIASPLGTLPACAPPRSSSAPQADLAAFPFTRVSPGGRRGPDSDPTPVLTAANSVQSLLCATTSIPVVGRTPVHDPTPLPLALHALGRGATSAGYGASRGSGTPTTPHVDVSMGRGGGRDGLGCATPGTPPGAYAAARAVETPVTPADAPPAAPHGAHADMRAASDSTVGAMPVDNHVDDDGIHRGVAAAPRSGGRSPLVRHAVLDGPEVVSATATPSSPGSPAGGPLDAATDHDIVSPRDSGRGSGPIGPLRLSYGSAGVTDSSYHDASPPPPSAPPAPWARAAPLGAPAGPVGPPPLAPAASAPAGAPSARMGTPPRGTAPSLLTATAFASAIAAGLAAQPGGRLASAAATAHARSATDSAGAPRGADAAPSALESTVGHHLPVRNSTHAPLERGGAPDDHGQAADGCLCHNVGMVAHLVPMYDDQAVYEPLYPVLRCLNIIAAHRARGRNVLVHCHAGLNRSALIVVAYLLFTTSLSLPTAVRIVARKRPGILSNRKFQRQLVTIAGSIGRLRCDPQPAHGATISLDYVHGGRHVPDLALFPALPPILSRPRITAYNHIVVETTPYAAGAAADRADTSCARCPTCVEVASRRPVDGRRAYTDPTPDPSACAHAARDGVMFAPGDLGSPLPYPHASAAVDMGPTARLSCPPAHDPHDAATVAGARARDTSTPTAASACGGSCGARGCGRTANDDENVVVDPRAERGYNPPATKRCRLGGVGVHQGVSVHEARPVARDGSPATPTRAPATSVGCETPAAVMPYNFARSNETYFGALLGREFNSYSPAMHRSRGRHNGPPRAQRGRPERSVRPAPAVRDPRRPFNDIVTRLLFASPGGTPTPAVAGAAAPPPPPALGVGWGTSGGTFDAVPLQRPTATSMIPPIPPAAALDMHGSTLAYLGSGPTAAHAPVPLGGAAPMLDATPPPMLPTSSGPMSGTSTPPRAPMATTGAY